MLEDIKKSVTFSFKDKYWVNYMIMYAVLCYIPFFVVLLSACFHSTIIFVSIKPFLQFFNFLGFIPLGFIIHSVYKELNGIKDEEQTFRQSFSEAFKTGVNLFVLTFLYSFVMLFIFMLIIGYFVMNDYFDLMDLLSPTFLFQNEVVLTILACLIILFIFTLVLIPYFFVAFAEKKDLLDAFNWRMIFKRLCSSWKGFIASVACVLLVNVIITTTALFLVIASKSAIRSLAVNYLGSAGYGNVSVSMVFLLLIIISGILVMSIAALSFIGLMFLFDVMARVYEFPTKQAKISET